MQPSKQVCVVGAGEWGSNHIRTLFELGALGGIVDSSENIRGKLVRKNDKIDNIKKELYEKEILQILRKGFIIVQNDKEEIINSVSQFKAEKEKKLIFHDGSIVIK